MLFFAGNWRFVVTTPLFFACWSFWFLPGAIIGMFNFITNSFGVVATFVVMTFLINLGKQMGRISTAPEMSAVEEFFDNFSIGKMKYIEEILHVSKNYFLFFRFLFVFSHRRTDFHRLGFHRILMHSRHWKSKIFQQSTMFPILKDWIVLARPWKNETDDGGKSDHNKFLASLRYKCHRFRWISSCNFQCLRICCNLLALRCLSSWTQFWVNHLSKFSAI